MDNSSKITKVLIKKIHGGRKQDSNFWQSEFSNDPGQKTTKQPDVVRFALFPLVILALGISVFVAYNIYNKFFATSGISTNSTSSYSQPQQHKPDSNKSFVTKKDLDRAINNAFASRSITSDEKVIPEPDLFYYRVELINGGKIESHDLSKNGDIFTIKDKNGLVFSINKNEILNIKKIKL